MSKRLHPAVRKYYARLASLGGRARAKALSPARRQRIARMGGKASAGKPRRRKALKDSRRAA